MSPEKISILRNLISVFISEEWAVDFDELIENMYEMQNRIDQEF